MSDAKLDQAAVSQIVRRIEAVMKDVYIPGIKGEIRQDLERIIHDVISTMRPTIESWVRDEVETQFRLIYERRARLLRG